MIEHDDRGRQRGIIWRDDPVVLEIAMLFVFVGAALVIFGLSVFGYQCFTFGSVMDFGSQ